MVDSLAYAAVPCVWRSEAYLLSVDGYPSAIVRVKYSGRGLGLITVKGLNKISVAIKKLSVFRRNLNQMMSADLVLRVAREL